MPATKIHTSTEIMMYLAIFALLLLFFGFFTKSSLAFSASFF